MEILFYAQLKSKCRLQFSLTNQITDVIVSWAQIKKPEAGAAGYVDLRPCWMKGPGGSGPDLSTAEWDHSRGRMIPGGSV